MCIHDCLYVHNLLCSYCAVVSYPFPNLFQNLLSISMLGVMQSYVTVILLALLVAPPPPTGLSRTVMIVAKVPNITISWEVCFVQHI